MSGIIVLDQLASSAAIGPSAIGWWVVTLVFFSIPYAAITSELGSAWPAQGGVYVWVREAFGARWGARATWYYWAQLTVWIPSVAILAASMSSQLFAPGMAMEEKVGLALVYVVAIGVFGSLRAEEGKWLPNVGAMMKVIIMLVIGACGVWLVVRGEARSDFTLTALTPSYDGAIAFLPIIVFNLMGFELICAAGDEIKDPARNIPRAIVASVLMIGGLYIFATFGLLAALPSDEIVLDTGIIEALSVVFAETPGGEFIVRLLGAAVIVTLVTNMITWALGANRMMREAALEGQVPSLFGVSTPRLDTPVAANAVMTAASCVILLIYYWMATTVEDLFWTLLAFSSLIFFLPYLLMFAGFLKLRASAPDRPRPFRVWGGAVGSWIAASLCIAFILQAMVLFVHAPGSAFDWTYTSSILAGCAAAILVGEIMIVRGSGAGPAPLPTDTQGRRR